jgi:hypothetical protein
VLDIRRPIKRFTSGNIPIQEHRQDEGGGETLEQPAVHILDMGFQLHGLLFLESPVTAAMTS